VYIISGSALDRANEIAKARNFKVDVYVDAKGELAKHFEVTYTPQLLLFDAARKLSGSYDDLDSVPKGESGALPRFNPVGDSGTELGTAYDVVIMAADETKAIEDLKAAREVLHVCERHLSEWKNDSDITELNRSAFVKPFEAKGDLLKIIKASLQVSKATDGAFDITWLPLGKLWDDAAKANKLPTKEEIDAVLKAVGYDKIELSGSLVSFKHENTKIGLGGVAKGWIVDAVFLELKKRGYENLIVRIGGDMRTCGTGPEGKWNFRITDPWDQSKFVGTFDLEDAAVSTSGQYFRFNEIEGKRYGHIIDPRTGWPATFEGSVSVITHDSAMADALSKALFIMGPEKGIEWVKKHPGIEVIYATSEGLKSTLNVK
jgi:thiamine biosynthesis lipoprotein